MNELVTKQAINSLMFRAMSEIMLLQYDNTTMLKEYDSSLHLKLKNLKANFERESKKSFTMFSENEQKVFFQLIDIFEKIIDHSKNEMDFSGLISLIIEWEESLTFKQ